MQALQLGYRLAQIMNAPTVALTIPVDTVLHLRLEAPKDFAIGIRLMHQVTARKAVPKRVVSNRDAVLSSVPIWSNVFGSRAQHSRRGHEAPARWCVRRFVSTLNLASRDRSG